MALRVDRDRCVGAGMCALVAPDVFTQADDDGRVILLVEVSPSSVTPDLEQAVMMCPSGALSLSDA